MFMSAMFAHTWTRRAKASVNSRSDRSSSISSPITKRGALIISTMAISVLFCAPPASADPTTHLKSETDAARSESGCPPLKLDPVLNTISQRIAHEVDDYVRHAATTTLPTTGEIDLMATGSGGLLKVMRESGYSTNKAKLLNGFGDQNVGGPGDNEYKAIRSLVLEGLSFEALPDCGYTKYGLSAINDNNTQGWPSSPPKTYSVAVVVLADA